MDDCDFDFGQAGGTQTDLGSIFGRLFGRGQGARRPRRGQDLEHPTEVTLEPGGA